MVKKSIPAHICNDVSDVEIKRHNNLSCPFTSTNPIT